MQKSLIDFREGLKTIRGELGAQLRQRGLRNVSIFYTADRAKPRHVTFTVTADGNQASQDFTREDIDDSARRLDAFARTKVRLILSHFQGA